MPTPALAHITMAVGALTLFVGLAGLLFPDLWRRALVAFPRHTPTAWILTAIAMTWIALIVLNASLGSFNRWKPLVYVLAPAAFFLLVRYLDELLAPRALGGLLILLPDPMLDAARWHPSDARYVITVLAYVYAVAGMLLVLGPYRFRRWTAWWIESSGRLRAGAALKTAFAAVLLYLAFRVY